MPRKSHLISTEYPYHINARTHSGQFFALEMPLAWEIMCDYLFFVKHAYKVNICSFVLMSNHFHMIARTPLGNLSAAMNYFMRETSKEFNRRSKKEDQFYGNRYYRTLIPKDIYLSHAYKYVYRNPVEAGLVGKCEEYPYSTLRGVLGGQHLVIPLEEDKFIFSQSGGESKTLSWLNNAPDRGHLKDIETALKRKEFYLPKNSLNKKPHSLEVETF